MVKKLKWNLVIMSLLYVGLGIFLVMKPGTALNIVCYALGGVVLACAAVQLIRYFVAERGVFQSQLTLISGLVCLALGVFLLLRSDIVVKILPIVFGLFVIFDAIGRVQNALDLRRCGYDSWKGFLLLPVLSVVLGVVLVINPFGAMETLVMAIGIILIVEGAINLLSALYTVLAVRRFAKLHPETQSVLEAITGEDLNGDGKTVVTLNVYTLDYSAGDAQTESDAYLTMAGTTKLATDVQGGLSSVFLLWDPAGFEESTGSLRYLDGTLPAADSDEDWWNMVYKWSDCPVLAGLDLGSYGPDTTQSRSGSSQEYMSRFYVGMRGAWNSGTADNLAGGEEFWQKLTEGAASTAAPED